MDTGGDDDDDVKLLRASTSNLADLGKLILRLVRKRKNTSNDARSQVRLIDLGRIQALIEPFQEDPQLLDTHLKSFIPPLVAAYLDSLQQGRRPDPKKGYVPLTHAICQILNLFCKVRGEKVIKGFLNNEPRYLEPVIDEFEAGADSPPGEDEPLAQGIVPWTERYVLFLWLSHLMLAPFPLASMSAMQSSHEVANALDIQLPTEVPGIALRVLTMCVKAFTSASKERGAAAHLLVRLCVRPDMQKLGLLETFVQWSLKFFNSATEQSTNIHQCIGILSFLSGLVTSATNEEIGPFLPAIYKVSQNIIAQPDLAFVKTSAVARKLIIKTLRNIVVHSLQATEAVNELDTTTVVEEVIELLLDSVADGDTPVRYAASKALSIITMKLDGEMAEEVVQAILGSLNENVYWQGSTRNLSGVDPLRWHGLTLTLSQLLYRRALSPAQLPDILNALLLALAFEQRSTTGGSIGTNVRDAACFGIWALSRRYTTAELSAVETSSVRASEHRRGISILQVLAIELLVVACLDPAGNIRRGSSAALQELIGRHPNTVYEGISLVQVVDFHAVGLRQRAMCKVSIEASRLHQAYWEALFDNVLGWRGIGSLDSASRLFAARAVGQLTVGKTASVIHSMSDRISRELAVLKPRQVEERQGLVSALAALVDENRMRDDSTEANETRDAADLTHLWDLLERELKLDDNAFMSPAMRPDFTASSICNLLGALSCMRYSAHDHEQRQVPVEELTRLLNLSLSRHADSVMEAIPRTTSGVLKLLQRLSPSDADSLVAGWLTRLENEASYNGLRWSGYAIALGAAYPWLASGRTGPSPMQRQIAEILPFRCTSAVSIEARTVALSALSILIKNCASITPLSELPSAIRDRVANALHVALNDYTVTERGDVGALVRLEALNTTGTAWNSGLLRGSTHEEDLHADVLRLSLEKLDKVRSRAAQVLEKGSFELFNAVAAGVADGVSSYAYFANALTVLKPSSSPAIIEAVCLGYMTSAGMGSESVVQNSRAALLDAIDVWPTTPTGDDDTFNLFQVINCLLGLLKQNLETERVLLPLLEIFAFLFDMQVMHRLLETSFNFRALLSYTQKAHFRSTHMQKLQLALDVYRGLGTIATTRADTITKLNSMLLHPFPKIRIAAAETLWLVVGEESLKRQDWSLPSKSLKPIVSNIKSALAASS
ncbi:hypothetical protein DPSP01_001601 [Paraphaeosphaeria sporulosa]|uniref:Uncharacterized protein n=1 Tax=Paraphaeosphaeria sporulosa TaxID=1460663 RepID=A0A177CT12_9PLEO|nr:uncharacterized protein CC84DRAFT_1111979 [Paraphaeosphaeria sporulosa]OAG10062.1 hypothetical protein CC84DRAFT_1111979 [Paraphaeosphaeria sporulosa]